jgi:putative transposase
MNFVLEPIHLLVAIIAGWVNRQQQEAIDYLMTQCQVLIETHGPTRILLTDDQRRRLAVKGTILGRKRLEEIGPLFTPDTILRWHRTLVARKWDYSHKRAKKPVGRPAVSEEVAQLVLRMAKENPTWGYDRIQGAVANLQHEISDTTVGNILRAHGIEPAPSRKRSTSWKTFQAHWDVLSAIDFTTVEVWTKGGLVTFYLLFAIKLSTRRVSFAGCTTNPHDLWMKQIARNLTDPYDGVLGDGSYLLMDRDGKYSEAFRDLLQDEGVELIRLPAKSPNLNAYAERFMRSLKEECLDRLIFFGEHALRNAVNQFLDHYHRERNHQGLDNQLIDPGEEVGWSAGKVVSRERLGGMLRYYYRDAA